MTAKELGLPETKTLRDQLVLFLVSNGLWPDEANAVMDIVVAEKPHEEVKFNSAVGDYPEQLVALLKMASARTAVAWIDEHKPEHFARKILVANFEN